MNTTITRLEDYRCLDEAATRTLTDQEMRVMLTLVMRRQSDGDLPAREILQDIINQHLPLRILYSRIEHHLKSINKKVEDHVGLDVLVMAASTDTLTTPCEAVMWAYTLLLYASEAPERKCSFDYMTYHTSFSTGLPLKEEIHRVWDKQKRTPTKGIHEPDNWLDMPAQWQLILDTLSRSSG